MGPCQSTTKEDKHDQSTKLNKELGNLKSRLWGLMAKSLESDSWVFFSPNFFQVVKKIRRILSERRKLGTYFEPLIKIILELLSGLWCYYPWPIFSI